MTVTLGESLLPQHSPFGKCKSHLSLSLNMLHIWLASYGYEATHMACLSRTLVCRKVTGPKPDCLLWPSLVPRRGEREGKKERLVSTVCACALISKNSLKIVSLAGISATLTSVRLPIFSVWKMNTTTTLCVNDDEGAMKAVSFSVAGMIHAFVHSS